MKWAFLTTLQGRPAINLSLRADAAGATGAAGMSWETLGGGREAFGPCGSSRLYLLPRPVRLGGREPLAPWVWRTLPSAA